MQEFSTAIRDAVKAEAWFSGLFLALAMPDICGKLAWPTLGNGARYKQWFGQYLSSSFSGDTGGVTSGHEFVTPNDAWQLRCSMLHEGSDEVGPANNARPFAVAKFQFSTTGSHLVNVNGVLVLSIARFCDAFADAVDRWGADVQSDTDVQARIAKRSTIKIQGFQLPGVFVDRSASDGALEATAAEFEKLMDNETAERFRKALRHAKDVENASRREQSHDILRDVATKLDVVDLKVWLRGEFGVGGFPGIFGP